MTHVSMQPQLEALRLEYAGALFDSAAARLVQCGNHHELFELPDDDASRLLSAAELITWLAQQCRRYAAEFRAIDEMNAASWRDEPVVPDNVSAFAFPHSAPPAPPGPERLVTIKSPSLDFVRERLQEAQDVLNYGGSKTALAAAGLAGRIQRWSDGG